MGGLNNTRVALLEARMGGELASLIRRFGGEPHCVAAVREEVLDCREQVEEFIEKLVAGDISVVVFSTGVGVNALSQEAEKINRLSELVAALKSITTVCRGPKPTAALAKHDIKPTLKAREPYTTIELLEAMSDLNLENVGVALLHYGERNIALFDALQARGAKLTELCLYEWQLPEDVDALRTLIAEIINNRFDAVAFTSQIQARHLFQIADEMQRTEALKEALNDKTIVAAVGPTCAAALDGFGISPHVVPEHPKMGAMVAALAEFIEQGGGR